MLTSGAFKDYGQAWGWRLGANVIQVRQANTLIGLKFYYQSLTEKQDRVEPTFNEEIALEIKQWNFGMSISYIVSQAFDIRALDAYISWTSAKLTNNYSNTENPVENVYESPESNIGFTADIGIVWYPIPTATFMSLELLGGYSYFTVDKVTLKEGNSSLTTVEDIIDGGGFFATAVFTIGIPFN